MDHQKGLQSNSQSDLSLYKVVNSIDKETIDRLNRSRAWEYGYNEKYDTIVISKTGQIGDIYLIQGLYIALPPVFDEIKSRSDIKAEQYWEREEVPNELLRIKSLKHWNETPAAFKEAWTPHIEKQFEHRENGYWFMNNGIPTYITGSHWFYLQVAKIDVGYPDFREANRIIFIHWEACVADRRCYGQNYLKIRRSGYSFMGASECINVGTLVPNAKIGILSKTGKDAKDMFTDKVVPINTYLPFYFKPVMDGMDKPKTELSFRVPASKITKNNMFSAGSVDDEVEGLNTTIDWQATGNNSYDSHKLRLLLHDECYSPETLILTEDWIFKQIKDIEIGDKVIIDGGIIKTVVRKISGETDTYRVKQPYGKDYVVTGNHRMVLNKYRVEKQEEVIMTPEQYVKSSGYAKKHLTRICSKGIESEDCYTGIPPYLLGLWLGDGRKRDLTILVNQSEEPEILEYLEKISKEFGAGHRIKTVKCKKIIEFVFYESRDRLREIGVFGNKHIPQEYMRSSIKTRLQVLAGIVDTDGHSNRKKGCIEIGMSNEKLIEQIRFLALSCGLSCGNIAYKNSNFNTSVYRIMISGDLSIIPIITKKKTFKDYTPKTKGRRNTVDVEYIGIGEYVGIQVDGETDADRRLILSDFTVSMNCGKWLKPNTFTQNWRVTKTCLKIGVKIAGKLNKGKCMAGSTPNALKEGGQEFKEIYENSDVSKRSKNGETPSGLYALYIPTEWNHEEFLDIYGMPVFRTPAKPITGLNGVHINQGVLDWWENEVESKKNDPNELNEFYRQYSRTVGQAFRDESKQSIFNLTKIYDQIDFNDSLVIERHLTRGTFSWKDGVKDSKVVWTPDIRGRFLVGWLPPAHLQNKVINRNGKFFPGNEHIGSFGCDPYDISAVVGGRGSNGSLHGMTKFHMDEGPINTFFLEYIARPQTAEIFFEEVLMALFFYGMPALVENNRPRLLYHLKNRGYRAFSISRPDKHFAKLNQSEKELGGIPNSSQDVIQSHGDAIGTYVEKHIGYDHAGEYREPGEIGSMLFNRTLQDWGRFDINDREKFDASISSGLAIMANQKHIYLPEKKSEKIIVTLPKYSQFGMTSRLIDN